MSPYYDSMIFHFVKRLYDYMLLGIYNCLSLHGKYLKVKNYYSIVFSLYYVYTTKEINILLT